MEHFIYIYMTHRDSFVVILTSRPNVLLTAVGMKHAKVQRFRVCDRCEKSRRFITTKTVGRRRAPSAAVKRLVVEIDPYSHRDRLRVA